MSAKVSPQGWSRRGSDRHTRYRRHDDIALADSQIVLVICLISQLPLKAETETCRCPWQVEETGGAIPVYRGA